MGEPLSVQVETFIAHRLQTRKTPPGVNIGDDTCALLRAEIRERYRLRGDGVLPPQDCAESTGRILARFDVET